LKHLSEGWISIQSQRLNLGLGLAWDPAVFRYVWLWQALGGGLGYPWYGRTYNIGIEPWTSYPCVGLVNAVQNGSARQLQPGESLAAWLTAVVFTDRADVHHIDRDGSVT
jgi:hypothetical protein